ncbi:MAG: alanine racemase [Gammaproteobacteria bacterium]|jgi:alanine racemase|nr:alanine racemase [Gammaproteobacteria bacterium]NDB25728.1 alanine racemase [Gammaproteobacteria bacterium]
MTTRTSAPSRIPTPIVARVSLAAWRHNFATLKAAAPQSKFLAVIKADAYGHGAVQAARALKEADAFGVARLGEGVELRAAGVRQPIVLMEGTFSHEELALALHHELDLVVHDETQLSMLEERARTAAAGTDPPRVVWLKLDTGMSRLGFAPDRARNAAERLRVLPMVGELRVMTHFACADEPDSSMTREQLARFELAIKEINPPVIGRGTAVSSVVGLANSAAILQFPSTHRDWVRAGIALYGSSPILGRSAAAIGLKPVMTLASRVIALRELQPGQSVGYGASWRATRRSRIATVAAGYADGLSRHLPSGAPVLVAGRRVPLVGRVSMDMITVDVTDLDDVRVGSEVVLWGDGLPVDEVAAAAGTIAYELLCAVTRRVAFEYF